MRVATSARDGFKYVVKEIRKDALDSIDDIDRVQTEIHLLSTLNHPHILRLSKVFHLPKAIYICTEYLGEDLRGFAKRNASRPNESLTRQVFGQVVSAIQFMHSRSVCHRDLKLGNILCVPSDKETIRLAAPGRTIEALI